MRFESKYYLQCTNESKLHDFCRAHGSLDKNCLDADGYEIESIYKTDWTVDNIQGKIRLRKYCVANQSFYFIEEKIKQEGIGTKNRIEIDEALFQAFLSCRNVDEFTRLLKSNHICFFNHFNHVYTYGIKYFRVPWEVCYKGNKYRITVDKNLIVQKEEKEVSLLQEGYNIVEIKGKESKKAEAIELFQLLETECALQAAKISKHSIAKEYYRS